MSTASPIKTNEQVRLNPIVFFGSTALILVLTAALILYPDSAGALLGRIQAWLSHSFGWYYMLAIGAYLFFVACPDGSHAFAETLEEHNLNVRATDRGECPQ